MTTTNLPPAPDLPALILQEHRRAELQRLDEGMAGCGCTQCQMFYREIDLSKYGKRVKFYGDYILVVEKSRQNTDSETSQTDNVPLPDKQGAVTKITDDKRLLPDTLQGDNGIMLQRRGRPQKPDSEPVSRMTLYRRQKQIMRQP